jgi:hypothetical protein
MGKVYVLFFLAFMTATIWAGHDSAARFNRCTDRQSLAHCRLIFYGR